jgi:flagellar basal-body rod protein FlgC
MMDYFSSFEISASGLVAEKLRLEAIAMNLANANSTAAPGQVLYQPVRVVTRPIGSGDFATHLHGAERQLPAGVLTSGFETVSAQPRMVYDPTHPDADASGFVAHVNIDPLSEMVNMTTAVRAYEANIKAIGAAKIMAQKALEIGNTK